jgi:hypothetical protein
VQTVASLDEQLEVADRLLARNLAWIAAADGKVPAVFGIDAAMLGVLSALLPAATHWTVIAAIAAGIAATLLILSIILLAQATFPRLTGPKGSLIFFGTAVAMSDAEFVVRVREGITENLIIDTAKQAHRNAEIAMDKYRHIKHAQLALFVGTAPWLLAIGLLYLART